MPGRDTTGPQGQGPATGRGMGLCGGGLMGRRGWFGQGLGFGRRWTKVDEKAALNEEEEMLKEELRQVQEEKKALGK
ncbi:MAG: DUF5320 family protein [Patescibacteria group bacterium]